MTILGRGDLSPPRRPHRRGAAVVTVLLLAALGAGAWFGWRAWRHDRGSTRAVVRTCTTPTAAPAPAAPESVTVSVLNATKTVGLAHQVATALTARRFHVAKVGNTAAGVSGVAVVAYPAGSEGAARGVAEQVPGAVLSLAPGGGVTLRLGPGFRGLGTPAEVAAARARDLAAASPRPPSCSGS